MYTGLLHLHSVLRWIILLLLVIAIFMSLGGMTGKKPFAAGQKKVGLFLMIVAHIELLIGLYQWLFGPWGIKYLSNAGMKDRVALFYGVEHITGMIIAIVLITIGRGVSKKEAERRAWATENAMSGGGKKSGSGRGKKTNKAPAKKGGKKGGAASAARPKAARKASAKKAAATRKRRGS